MGSELLVDNDIIIKLGAYGLLPEFSRILGSSVGVLGAAPYVVRGVLRNHSFGDHENELGAFLEAADKVEPTGDEIELSDQIEGAAIRAGLDLDNGESQLFAIAIIRTVNYVATGDKRAITAAQTLVSVVAELGSLQARILCLEQLISSIIKSVNADLIRSAVCKQPDVDKAMAICFSCAVPEIDCTPEPKLESYINDLRLVAPDLLATGYEIPT